jgi:2-dehydropantoate 2-reductase
MKFAVFGAGAIGGLIAARLAATGQDVSVVARGAHLAAIQQRGLRVRSGIFGESTCRPRASKDPAEIGPVDVVVLAVKAHSLSGIAPSLGALFGPDTICVTTQNGIPWWYFEGLGGRWAGTRLESVDPGGTIAAHIDSRRIIGSVVYISASLAEPGVLDHVEGARLPVGELDGSRSTRVQNLASVFTDAGLKSSVRSNIRADIWTKLLGNATFNPISALTRATMKQLLDTPETRRLIAEGMEEVRAVASALDVAISVSTEKRIAGAEQVGHHKTSMLQDLEAGRPLELEPILGAVVELAGKTGVSVPRLESLYACAQLLSANISHPMD